MKSGLRQLLEQLEEALSQQETKPSKSATTLITDAVSLLTDWIMKEGFAGPDEEINFFKHVAPSFFSRLIFLQKRYQLDIQSSCGDFSSRKRLIKQFRKKIGYFFNANAPFLSYYASGATDQDSLYFLRINQNNLRASDDWALFVDRRICTLATYKIAKMIAYQKLDSFLRAWQAELNAEMNNPVPARFKNALQWTASKSAATELAYGLFSSGIFNNGQARLKEIIYAFEQCFQIDLGGYQSAYQDMKMRKKSRTAFLSDLRQKLESKMDEEEE